MQISWFRPREQKSEKICDDRIALGGDNGTSIYEKIPPACGLWHDIVLSFVTNEPNEQRWYLQHDAKKVELKLFGCQKCNDCQVIIYQPLLHLNIYIDPRLLLLLLGCFFVQLNIQCLPILFKIHQRFKGCIEKSPLNFVLREKIPILHIWKL